MKLSSMVGLALLGGWLALAVACKRTEPPKQPASSPPVSRTAPAARAVPPTQGASAAPVEIKLPEEPKVDWRVLLEELGPPSLITLEETNGRCDWSVLRPPELEARRFMVTHVCPSGLVWDRRGGRSLFVIEGGVYLHDWKSGQVKELEPPALGEPEFGFSATGAILACHFDVQNEVLYRETQQRQSDGSWQQIGYENFGQEYTSFPCSNSNDAELTGEMRYNPRYQDALTCDAKARPANAKCPSEATLESVRLRFADQTNALVYPVYVAFGDRSFIAYRHSDTMEVTTIAPVLAIREGAIREGAIREGAIQERAVQEGTVQEGAVKEGAVKEGAVEEETVVEIYSRRPRDAEVDVLLGADYFLVRAAGEATHATLFKKGQVEPVKEFPDATIVTWIPGTIPPGDLIEVIPDGSGDEG